MLFQVSAVACLSFAVLLVTQTYYQCSAVNANFDLSKVYDMPMSEIEANFPSIIETMKKEEFNNIKYFNKSELVTFALTPTHGENKTFMIERWHDMCDYFLDKGNIEDFKLYVLNRFPPTKTTWWGPLPKVTSPKTNRTRKTKPKEPTN